MESKDFEAMTVEELREYGDRHKVELKSHMRKDEIIEALREHEGETPGPTEPGQIFGPESEAAAAERRKEIQDMVAAAQRKGGIVLEARRECQCGERTLQPGDPVAVVELDEGVPLNWVIDAFRNGFCGEAQSEE